MPPSSSDLIKRMESDGFLILKDFLNPTAVKKAFSEVNECFQRDLKERTEAQCTSKSFKGSASAWSSLEPGKYLLVDFYGKSPTLDRLCDEFLSHPDIKAVTSAAIGQHYKLRGYNVRRMTGPVDLSAMEWHRDNPGEFNFAIILTETASEGDAATAFVPGSHLYPWCPFAKALMPMPYAKFNPRLGFFSRLLFRKINRKAVAASGNLGDVYLFFGDTWHSRQANLNGRLGTVLFIGAFPSEVPFPSPTDAPPDDILNALPENLRATLRYDDIPTNSVKSPLQKMLDTRNTAPSFFSLMYFAQAERRVLDSALEGFAQFNTKVIVPAATFFSVVIRKTKTLKRIIFSKVLG